MPPTPVRRYHALRYVSGPGQRVVYGKGFVHPIYAGVEDERGRPVVGARVRFEIVDGNPGDRVHSPMSEPSPPGQVAYDVSDGYGVALCGWSLAGDGDRVGENWCRVVAWLVNPPQREAMPLMFVATVETADTWPPVFREQEDTGAPLDFTDPAWRRLPPQPR